ncbi:hypothetical protein [Dickeya dadantii]|uniref:hypothetical protein n=1 Tax=Dickeya dadantii TaxID=204038 RepID=UPI000AB836D0|nr:hypothetical protein [Dickeya dadantii]
MLEAKQIAELLNQLFATDPSAAAALVNHRVVCNDEFLGSDIPSSARSLVMVSSLWVSSGLLMQWRSPALAMPLQFTAMTTN